RHECIRGRLEPRLFAREKAPAAIGILGSPKEIEAGGERIAHYNWTGVRKAKLIFVSTGMRTFFLPVKATAAVPAPAPAPAPMRAPAGPPAKAPIAAPPAAPPPIPKMLRFLWDVLERPACVVDISYFLPFNSKESRLRFMIARPLSLPEGADVSMRPENLAPFGMAMFPS